MSSDRADGHDWSYYRSLEGETERYTFRAPVEMIDQLDEAVDAERAPNRSEAIRRAIAGWLRDDVIRADGGLTSLVDSRGEDQ